MLRFGLPESQRFIFSSQALKTQGHITISQLDQLFHASPHDHGRLSLTLSKSLGLLAVDVHALEFPAVGIEQRDKPIVMFSSAIASKDTLLFFRNHREQLYPDQNVGGTAYSEEANPSSLLSGC